MPLKKDRGRIHGKVRFTCPVCDQQYEPADVSIPPRDVGISDLRVESVVVVSDGDSPAGIQLCAELVRDCTKCNVKLKQFVTIAE